MQIKFRHNFGHQEQGEFFHCGVEAVEVMPEEYNTALEIGFLIQVVNGVPKWYQSRSTRVRTANTFYDLLPDAKLLANPLPYVEMDHIYTAYCYYKKFKKYFEYIHPPNTQQNVTIQESLLCAHNDKKMFSGERNKLIFLIHQ